VISAPKLSTPKRESKLWLPSFFSKNLSNIMV
jgi:hypothetical protein